MAEKWEELERLESKAAACEERFSSLLCGRCEHGLVFRREGKVDLSIYCLYMKREMAGDIIECSRFTDPKHLTVSQMQDIALDIDARDGVNPKAYL